jgi:hypothetical protein
MPSSNLAQAVERAPADWSHRGLCQCDMPRAQQRPRKRLLKVL